MQPMEDCQSHLLALESLSCKHPTAWHKHVPHRIICSVLCLPLSIYIYISSPVAVTSSCKGNGCFSASSHCFLSLISSHSIHSRITFACRFFLQMLLLFFHLFVKSCVSCYSYTCAFYCLSGSYCVLGPQRWPQCFPYCKSSSPTSIRSLYKVIDCPFFYSN